MCSEVLLLVVGTGKGTTFAGRSSFFARSVASVNCSGAAVASEEAAGVDVDEPDGSGLLELSAKRNADGGGLTDCASAAACDGALADWAVDSEPENFSLAGAPLSWSFSSSLASVESGGASARREMGE